MPCDGYRADLVAFHFGEVQEPRRTELERHLQQCAGCLQGYLRLKRSIETGQDEPGPSELATARLRRAMVAELATRRRRSAWSWWERPLAVGFSCAALVGAIATTHALTTGPGSPPHQLRGAVP